MRSPPHRCIPEDAPRQLDGLGFRQIEAGEHEAVEILEAFFAIDEGERKMASRVVKKRSENGSPGAVAATTLPRPPQRARR